MNPATTTSPLALAAFIGIDWADQEHAVCLSVAGSDQLEEFRLPHHPQALAEFVATLRARFHGQPVGIALEQTRGGLVHALLGHDHLVLYPVNPAAAQRYREVFAPSGAKDDPPDARLLRELLVKHRDHLRPWRPDTVTARQLAFLCEHRRALVNQATKLAQQMTAALKAYFPQALEWAGEKLASPLACDFLIRWPTLAALQKAKPQTVRAFYYGHHCRRADQVNKRLQQIQTAVPLSGDTAVIESHALLVVALARALRALLPGIATYDRAIAALFATHPDAALFESLPAAGAVMAPRLAAAFGTDRERFPDADSIAQLSGIAPVTRRSGATMKVQRRRARAKFLCQTFHEWSGLTIQFCEWARQYYEAQRAAGKRHHAAVRALAYKWLRILWRCWRDRMAYDEEKYTAALRRHGSPLAARLSPAPPSEQP
jgi:transposase